MKEKPLFFIIEYKIMKYHEFLSTQKHLVQRKL